MLPKAVLDKIQYFNKQKYALKNDEIVLEEKSDSGKAVLKCILSKDTVILHDPEKNTLPYLDGEAVARQMSDNTVLVNVTKAIYQYWSDTQAYVDKYVKQ